MADPSQLSDRTAVDHSDTFGADVLSDFLLIPTDMIDAGERLRPIDPVWAEALGQIMLRERQRTPIEVCRLPGQNRWTLVSGGHRHAGAILAGIPYLRAEVVSANRDDRRMREVSENLWRKDLEPIDRAAFIAEAVAIHKRRANSTEDRARVAKVNTSLTKQINVEADDMLDTMSSTYGWSEEIGDQLGFSARTIRRDLMLYRRLAPSLVARLRDARHPVATNATQLRALAKLEESKQRAVVDMLLGARAKSVGDAIKLIDCKPVPDAETKRLSAFIGTFQRMGLTEKKGALAQLAALLPAGFNLVEGGDTARAPRFPAEHARYRDETLETIAAVRELIDGLVEDDVVPGERGADLERLGGQLAVARITIAGNGFEMGGAA